MQSAATSWWADKGDRFVDPADGWWPRDGYRMLLRSVGNWFERRDNLDNGRVLLPAIYSFGRQYADQEPDLQAIVTASPILYMDTGRARGL